MTEAVLTHQRCPHCDSSKGYTVYSDGSSYCFSCCKAEQSGTHTEEKKERRMNTELRLDVGVVPKDGITDRRLTAQTCDKYGVKVVVKAGGIAQHIYPYFDKDNNIIAQKIRTVEGKQFHARGDMKNAQLFGQNVFPTSGRYITVTEGEIDAMSVYQMLGSKYPVVSIKNGATSLKNIKEQYEYLDSFDNIVLCWDSDEAGVNAVTKIAEILPPKKVKIVRLPKEFKDPNEFLKAGRVSEFVDFWWRAETFKPVDIVGMDELWGRITDFVKTKKYIPTPWEGLNDKIYGVRPSQVIVFAAGTGMGKSAFLKEIIHHILKTTDERVGAFFLEEVAEDTAISLMSLEAGLNLKKPDVWKQQSDEDLAKWFQAASCEGRLDLYDGFDFDDVDLLKDKIRFLAKIRECSVIILDHITMVAEGGDENSTLKINKLMSNLKALAVEVGVVIIAACHLRKSANANKTHEEGGHVSLDDLKSSSSIKQLSDVVIGLERDSQAECPVEANTTKIRVLKNRDFGDKGLAAAVMYDKDTTRLVEKGLEEFNET